MFYPDGVAAFLVWAKRRKSRTEVRLPCSCHGSREWACDGAIGTGACATVAAFALVQGLPVVVDREVLSRCEGFLGCQGDLESRRTVRLELPVTAPENPTSHSGQMSRPLWTPALVRGTVVRCLN